MELLDDSSSPFPDTHFQTETVWSQKLNPIDGSFKDTLVFMGSLICSGQDFGGHGGGIDPAPPP
jgi:hypothetical protein